MTTLRILLIIVFLLTGVFSFSQFSIDTLLGKIEPQKWSASIERKAEQLQEKIIVSSLKTLGKLQKHEEKIYRRILATKDSLQAKMALADIKNKYQSLKDKIENPPIPGAAKQYIPKLDTLTTSLKFLEQNGITGKVQDALAKTELLHGKFQQAEEIKKFIRERRQQLKAQLENLGLVKELKKFNKEVYYYAAQIKEYGELLKDSRKAERKAIELLSKTKLFQDFMRKNSMLASLFRIPGDPNDPATLANLAGLQTRVQVNTLIQQQIGSGGPSAIDQFRQNIQSAQSEIDKLKNKISQFDGGSSDDIMPEGFKPNDQRTKSFWKRLEYGANMQTQKATNFFPVISDIGLSLGYKLTNKSIIGIGASYKLGWGQGWNHIKFTNEGAGLRSYIDWNMKGSFWISGGYEMNYRTAFTSLSILRDRSTWQQSGLLGASKVLNVKSKFFKKTKLQLLWDFLSYSQLPRTQPIIFRVGYNF